MLVLARDLDQPLLAAARVLSAELVAALVGEIGAAAAADTMVP